MTGQPLIVIAGATGDLGHRIARDLVARGADVRALVRPDPSDAARTRVEASGATLLAADPTDLAAMTAACAGAACVVSALNGLRDVVVDRQALLLDAAICAGVPRFIPSDYAADFTRTWPGDNRNLDLRRDFMAIVDAAPIRATSVLNGAFMDMLGAQMPLIQPRLRRVLYWQDADQLLDFTTKDDVAAYVAAVALDDAAPRILRVAGDSISARGLAAVLTEITGARYRPLWAGTIATLGAMIRIAKLIAPGDEEPFPAWQGMQYMRDQFSGRAKLLSIDNDRYPELRWTTVARMLADRAR